MATQNTTTQRRTNTTPQRRTNTTPQRRTKTTEPTTPTRWTNFKGLMTVWGKEVGKGKNTSIVYNTSVGRRNANGDFDNLYYDVRFAKDIDPKMVCKFEIIAKGFLTLNIGKDGLKYPAVYIEDFVFYDTEGTEADDDLPF